MIRLLPGPEAADTPALDDAPIDLAAWNSWLQIVDDRHAGRPSPLHVLACALDVDKFAWNFWWDREHPRGLLTHRAALVGVSTLVSACGYSTPARPQLRAWEIGDRAIRDSLRTYCTVCSGIDPWLNTA